MPELREQTQGNPIPNYLKAILDQDYSTQTENLSPAALKQVDRAARMDKPDWQILPKLKVDGISLLLPDLQKMRMLSTELQKRFREVLGRTIHEVIAGVRLRRVKQLLVETELSYDVLAARSGFSSRAYLSTAFREATGTTLAAYRRKHAAQHGPAFPTGAGASEPSGSR